MRYKLQETNGEFVSQRKMSWTTCGIRTVETGEGTLKRESFSIRNLNTDFSNYDGKDLHFTTTLRVEVPLVAGGFALTSMQKNLEVESCYAPKF